MKKSYIILKSFILGCILSVFTFSSYAQFDQVGDILKSGANEANTVFESYLTPLGKAWGYDLAGGWYNSAAVHKTLGFDLTLSVNFAQTPDEDLLFDLASLGLSKIQSTSANTMFPTITNGNVDDVNSITVIETVSEDITVNGVTQTVTQDVTLLPATELKGFEVPVGLPLPTINLGIGLPKGFELVGRFVPNTAIGDLGNLGLWGIGLKHDFLQWLPIVDKIPFLRASIFAGYTNFGMDVAIPFDPTTSVDDPGTYVNPENQAMNLNITAFHAAILVGAKLPIVHPYVSLGVVSSKFDLSMLGEYALPKPYAEVDNTTGIPTGNVLTTLDGTDPNFILTDPIAINIESGLKPSIAAGLRIKLAIFTFHAQYTIQEYTMITGGFGISFR
ncbi:MAG: hypothetical protein GXO79_13045 [Chlorobi bacterium]|nr:hypothetical protein [Chlorobiota bacterium]